MDGLFCKIVFLLTLLFSVNANAQTEVTCISHGDLEKIAKDFSQFNRFLTKQSEYCTQDMGEQWFAIANSLRVLMTLAPDEPNYDADDALTYKAITDKDWWAYFTKRADEFIIQSNCPQNVVAYVQPFFGQGKINLCQLFFEQTVSSQASTMMHEVRHFDGHRHVTCSQGNEKGNGGACDNEITKRGSYAISVQTLVGMARATETSVNEKPMLEAEAVYMAFNKFNSVPKVKLSNSIILSNDQSEVYSWNLRDGVEPVATLPEPSIVINSSNNLTVYPVDAQSEAYRTDKNLFVSVENPGLYAKHYNTESPEDRAQYKAISYFATGGLLKGNSLLSLCNRDSLKLAATNLDSRGQFVTIMSLSTDEKDEQRESILLAENGDMFRYTCQSKSSDEVRFEKLDMKIAQGADTIVDSFGFNGEQYALLNDGTLGLIQFQNNILRISALNLPMPNQGWISATPISLPEVF